MYAEFTVNVSVVGELPYGAGFTTPTAIDPGAAIADAGIVADSDPLAFRVAATVVAPNVTDVVPDSSVPVTVNVNEPLPAVIDVGEIEMIVGAVAVTVSTAG